MAECCLLYYITDRIQFPGNEPARRRALIDKITEAARAGVDYIQLREKELSAREQELLARDAMSAMSYGNSLRTESRELRTRLLINSRTDVAMAAGADGVHLRSDDVLPSEVQRVWTLCSTSAPKREKPCIAVSCHSRGDVVGAESQDADFAVFAPVFEKHNAPAVHPAGLSALQEACQAKIPVLALGGVTVENAGVCLRAGAAGIGAIRLFQENKIEDVVRALRALTA
jgi:thiamine-phosphate pyrophosphorylase